MTPITSPAGTTPAAAPRSRRTQKIGLLVTALALALPGTALARGGDGGGGGGTAPAPVTCVTASAVKSGEVDKPASGKPMTADYDLRNCGTTTVTLANRVVATSTTVTSFDPYTVRTCTLPAYDIPGITLKPGESRPVSGTAKLPYCGYDWWGVNGGYDVDYALTATDAATGATLATASTTILHRGGV